MKKSKYLKMNEVIKMKNYYLAIALAGVFSQTNASQVFEISEKELKSIFETRSYDFADKGTYSLYDIVPYLDDSTHVKGEITFDSNNPHTLKLQCLRPLVEVSSQVISIEESYSYPEDFAKKYITYRYNEGRGGNYFLNTITPVMNENGPIFEPFDAPIHLLNYNQIMQPIDFQIMFSSPHVLQIDDRKQVAPPAVVFEEQDPFSFGQMPKEVIFQIANFSSTSRESLVLQENALKRAMFNLGKVCKQFYSYFTSEYIIGSGGSGMQNVSMFSNKMRSLLNGQAEDMPAFRRVGAFNFSQLGKTMQLRINPYNTTLSPVDKYNYSGREIKITSSDMSILTMENKAWPFSRVSKILFSEYVSYQEFMSMFPDQPEMFSTSHCGEATFSVHGLDHKGSPISVSYAFYTPSINF